MSDGSTRGSVAPAPSSPRRPAPPSRWAYVAAKALSLLSFAAIAWIWGTAPSGLAQFVVPGKATLALTDVGTYTVYFERMSVLGDRIYVTETLPAVTLEVRHLESGSVMPVWTVNSDSSYALGGRIGMELLVFNVRETGSYRFTAAYRGGRDSPPAVLAVGKDFLGNLFEWTVIAIVFLVACELFARSVRRVRAEAPARSFRQARRPGQHMTDQATTSSHRPAPPRWWMLAAYALAALTGVLFLQVFWVILSGATRVVVPGEATLALTSRGFYTVSLEWESEVDGRTYVTEKVPGLRVQLHHLESGKPLSLREVLFSLSYEGDGHAGNSLLSFFVWKPGPYRLIATYDDGRDVPQVVLAVGMDVAPPLIVAIAFGWACWSFASRVRRRRAKAGLAHGP